MRALTIYKNIYNKVWLFTSLRKQKHKHQITQDREKREQASKRERETRKDFKERGNIM